MHEGSIRIPELETFHQDDWIGEVINVVKSGKEATVYCCRSGGRIGVEFVAAKVYRPSEHRSFRNDAIYREGRVILDKRIRRAVEKRTRTGKGAQATTWIDHEYATLKMLHKAGADVPQPYSQGSEVILMEFVGDAQSAAAPLRQVHLAHDEARYIFNIVMDNISLLLSCNCIHGDLSAFNILYWNGSVKIIDFPQAIDPRFNHSSFELLKRDIENICGYFERCGVVRDPMRLARGLWSDYISGNL